MQSMPRTRSLCYFFVCATPFIAAGLAAPRALRIPGMHQIVGIVIFVLIAFSVWLLASRGGEAEQTPAWRQRAVAGALLLAPFAVMALLWVGLATPWDATAEENQMRYLALAVMAIAVTTGFASARDALKETGGKLCATLAAAAVALAGPLYLVWDVFMFALYSSVARTQEVPDAFKVFDEASDLLLLLAGVLTYLAAALLALAMGRSGWLGKWPARVYALISAVALFLLVRRGVHFLAPGELAAPWFATPAFIVSIPAVPFIVPALIGAVMLRRSRVD